MPDHGPWNRQRSKIRAIREHFEDKTVGTRGIIAMHPDTSNLRSDFWIDATHSHDPSEGGKGVAIHSSTGGSINELV
jgi:hypothetical protein